MMGIELKVIKDGQPSVIEVEADSIDAKGMGFLATEQVDEFAARKVSEGAEKVKSELSSAIEAEKQRAEEALKQLEDYKSNLSKKDSEAIALNDRLKSMEEHLQKIEQARIEAEATARQTALKNEIVTARSSLSFVEGGAEVLDGHIEARRQKDGTYLLNSGLTGSVDDVVKEWTGTAVGKSLLVTSEKSGSGTAPGAPEDNSMSGADYIKAHGLPAYREMLERKRVRKSKTA